MRIDPVRVPDLLRSAFGLPAEIRAVASSLTWTPPERIKIDDCGVSREIVGRETGWK
jgi:hypothetical protein